ncbi:hypothetical protein AALA58_09005, partial [Lactococcus ileimucosae]
QPNQINFSIMAPGTIFTMAGEQYRYLENQGGGNHLIIRNESIRSVSFDGKDTVLNNWYAALDPAVQNMVQPVANSFTVGNVTANDIIWAGQNRWLPANLYVFPVVAADISQVDTSGTPRAFALSLADVTRLSGPGLAFSNHDERVGSNDTYWALRTFADSNNEFNWQISNAAGYGRLHSTRTNTVSSSGGIRPVLIVQQ